MIVHDQNSGSIYFYFHLIYLSVLELEFVLKFLYFYLVSCACQTIKYIPSKNVKTSSYIAQYLILRTVQSALHFTSLTDLFTQPPPRLLWEVSSHMLQLMREGCSYTYPPLSISRYSCTQLSELEQCRVKKNLPKILTLQHRIRTRIFVVESPKLYS